ncbi:MAG: DUF4870 domain-containing protein [Microthrixaceae bacterium]|nr:DUF4870 domain-containing protein [Microthrixaceae bacterium]
MSFDPNASGTPTPPGWYPDSTGSQRYWDGTQWTEHLAPGAPQHGGMQPYGGGGDDTTFATLVHILALFTSFIGPLIIYLVKGEESPFVKHHAAEALNFGITVFIAYAVSAVLMIVLIGFVLFPLVAIWSIVMPIIAALAANKGEWYRYPLTLRLVPGGR